MSVDLNSLGQTLNASNDNDLLRGLGMQYGVPECLMNVAIAGGAALLPSQVLGQMSSKIQAAKNKANDAISSTKKSVLLTLGLWEDDGEGGYVLRSIHSSEGLAGLGDAMGAIGGAIGTGLAIYEQYQELEAEYAALKDCWDQSALFFKSLEGGKDSGLTDDQINKRFATEMTKVENAKKFIVKADAALDAIGGVIFDRKQNPDLEPIIIEPSLSAFGKFIAPPVPTDPIFRLVFGPPKSKKGQFLLSVDGLYYDSQKGGLPQVTGYVPPEDYYKFNFPANLGGKGEIISLKKLDQYVDTVFDPSIIDDSKDMQDYYKADHFLNVLEGQRDKHLYDLSSGIEKIKAEEALQDDSAIIVNMKQSIYSVMAQHQSKINRRKKQIEVAIKSPYLAGKTPSFAPGQIPINDFSHLSNLNVAVAFDKQKKLMFKQGEVSGVVLPIQPKFVKAVDSKVAPSLDKLIVPSVGKGALIYDSSATDVQPTVLSLTDTIVTDNLIAVYNFLEGESVAPNSKVYSVLNCNSTNNYNNAQLVSMSTSSVFRRGLGIPFLTGITRLSNSTGSLSSIGNFVRLPDSKEFRDLTYKQQGFTFESWVHVPEINKAYDDAGYGVSADPEFGFGASAYHKILLGCENTGGVIPETLEDPDQAENTFSSDVVRGLLIGFTRDRQITQSLQPSQTPADNSEAQTVFYIAPTRSVNASDVCFINKGGTDGCLFGYQVLNCNVPLTQAITGTQNSVKDVSGQFMYFSVAVDPEQDQIRICVDGVLLKQASLSESFGLIRGQTIRAPSFAADNSFEYATSSTGKTVFNGGPKLNNFFTPWILGGGYTDGHKANNNGFMGKNHGLISGLHGYIGSTKFYSKPLAVSEVKKNYDSQKGFFKNIDLS